MAEGTNTLSLSLAAQRSSRYANPAPRLIERLPNGLWRVEHVGGLVETFPFDPRPAGERRHAHGTALRRD